MRFCDIATGGYCGPSGPSSSLASHQYRTPSSSLLGQMSRLKVSVTGVFVMLLDCTRPSGVCPL